ncbi:MAG: hypothetical protein ACTS44_00775 [Candidatus Hodgkinia cicadicola]
MLGYSISLFASWGVSLLTGRPPPNVMMLARTSPLVSAEEERSLAADDFRELFALLQRREVCFVCSLSLVLFFLILF